MNTGNSRIQKFDHPHKSENTFQHKNMRSQAIGVIGLLGLLDYWVCWTIGLSGQLDGLLWLLSTALCVVFAVAAEAFVSQQIVTFAATRYEIFRVA